MSDIVPENGGQEAESTGEATVDVQVQPARKRRDQVEKPDESQDLSGFALLYDYDKRLVVPPLPRANLTPQEASVYLHDIAGGLEGVMATGAFAPGPLFGEINILPAEKKG